MGNYRVDFNAKEIAKCVKVTKRESLWDYMHFKGGYLPFAYLHPDTQLMYALLLNAKSEDDARSKAKADIDAFYEMYDKRTETA